MELLPLIIRADARFVEPGGDHPPPPSPVVFVRRSEILHREGKQHEAGRLLERCLSVWPDAAIAHDRLAGVLLGQGDKEGALRHIKRALELEPGSGLYKMDTPFQIIQLHILSSAVFRYNRGTHIFREDIK